MKADGHVIDCVIKKPETKQKNVT